MDIDNEWDEFNEDESLEKSPQINDKNLRSINITELYISTKTKILYLNQVIDLQATFWHLPVEPYLSRHDCIIKKQIKMQCSTQEEVDTVQSYLRTCDRVIDQDIIFSSLTDTSMQQREFKDVRKISIGMNNKDILNHRSKKKSAFYNCYVVILRIFHELRFREVHVKVFNTGKLEIPGIRDDSLLIKVQRYFIDLLQPVVTEKLCFIDDKCETVLINSNFNCGYFINRDKLYNILRNKYNINATFDPCSYPGIQCKYKFNDDAHISFMVFRTGSVLIVGKADETMLFQVYDFLKQLMTDEYDKIADHTQIFDQTCKGQKLQKVRKRSINVSY